MFGLTVGQTVLIGLVLVGIVIYLAMRGKRDPALQAKALELLPDWGDKAWLSLQKQLPDDHELRDKIRRELDAADEKAIEGMKRYLESKGYSVSKTQETKP